MSEKLEKLSREIEKAKERRVAIDKKIRELEEKFVEQENTEIHDMVREARLTFADDSLVGLECERCGKMIHCGRFCKDCAGGLEEAMNGMFRQDIQLKGKPSSGGKMRFLE